MSPTGDEPNGLRETVALARGGDVSALGRLIQEQLPELQAFVRVRADALLVERESIEDVVQSVCREALCDLDEFEYRSAPELRSWLFLLATRKIVDRYRFHRQACRDVARERSIDGTASSVGGAAAMELTPSRYAVAREEIERLEQLLARLPEAQQEAVACSKLLGLSYVEIASRMGVSESAVRNLVARGLARLSTGLAREDGG